jgi:hypothetical protein
MVAVPTAPLTAAQAAAGHSERKRAEHTIRRKDYKGRLPYDEVSAQLSLIITLIMLSCR